VANDLAAELARISAELRVQANGGFRVELMRGLRAAAQPLVPAVQEAARRQLPKRGGLNQYEANQKIRVSVSTAARTVGVRLVGKASKGTDTGTWRHPTPELRGYDRSYWKWKEQTYKPATGWWTKTLERESPGIVRGALEAVIVNVSKKLR
jgi:hypothetical protein